MLLIIKYSITIDIPTSSAYYAAFAAVLVRRKIQLLQSPTLVSVLVFTYSCTNTCVLSFVYRTVSRVKLINSITSLWP